MSAGLHSKPRGSYILHVYASAHIYMCVFGVRLHSWLCPPAHLLTCLLTPLSHSNECEAGYDTQRHALFS